jgi:hypothetical protein
MHFSGLAGLPGKKIKNTETLLVSDSESNLGRSLLDVDSLSSFYAVSSQMALPCLLTS